MKNAGKASLTLPLLLAIMAAFPACERKEEVIPPPVSPIKWNWISGGETVDASGVYGTQGVADAANVPGAREDAVTWVDADDNLWLFGGYGYDSTGYPGRANDLWKYDPAAAAWTWVHGSSVRDQAGAYGVRGVPSPAACPGARNGAVSWTDTSGAFWLFGGLGFDEAGSIGQLNDLWKFDPATGQWAWMGGSTVRYQPGTYGAPGVADPSNVPGARTGAVSAVDGDGAFWLFGGYGHDAAGAKGRLNDLWKYDPAASLWTWISGSDAIDPIGVYGTVTEPDPANVPGGRSDAVAWIGFEGRFWLLGGDGLDFSGYRGRLNDLWSFDPATLEWTWEDGAKIPNVSGVYGDLNTQSTTSEPGGRYGAVSWISVQGVVWVSGGYTSDSLNAVGLTNDLWRYDQPIVSWTWLAGSSARGAAGAYGTKGTASSDNRPGARYFAISWIDSLGRRWLFGGYGLDSKGEGGRLNDLWRQD